MSLAHWIGADGSCHAVKNLGWLLRHAGEVTGLLLERVAGGDPVLEATLTGGRRYLAVFADSEVLRRWVGERRALASVPVVDRLG
jgi:hypothetical protein